MVMATSKKQQLIAAVNAESLGKERPPVNTIVFPLHPTEISDRINLPGSIEAWTRLELMAKVSGAFTEILVQEGEEVRKGDILAQIEDNDYKIALQRAEASYKLAKANYERDRAMFAKGVIPEAQRDDKEKNMLTAKADLDNAALLLSRTTIKAPIDGVVRRLDAKVGLFLSVGDPIGQILHINKVKGVVGIPESDVAAVRNLDEFQISIQALDNLVVTGKKYFLSPSPDTTARLYKMELEIDNTSRAVLPGMFIRADIVKRTIPDAIVIPFYSVISRNNEHFVFIEENGMAKKRIVELGIMEKWMVEIKSGLNVGDRLIIEGHRSIENDQKIEVVKVLTDLNEYIL
jgi:membrane fusion protein (multidrug efflux system)